MAAHIFLASETLQEKQMRFLFFILKNVIKATYLMAQTFEVIILQGQLNKKCDIRLGKQNNIGIFFTLSIVQKLPY